jgi:epoxyqueuosine reductase QueG
LGEKIAQELKDFLVARGAGLVAFADMGALPAEARGPAGAGRYAVSLAVALDRQVIKGIRAGGWKEYQQARARTDEMVKSLQAAATRFLLAQGAPAAESGAPRPTLPLKTAASRAGLGWIGKSGLIVTEPFGSAIRIGATYTNFELPAGTPSDRSRCGDCTVCVEACPARALSDRLWQVETGHIPMVNREACIQVGKGIAARIGYDGIACAECVILCPWTQKYLEEALA